MKQMTLTGLATEQSFENLGKAQFFLVFNGGALRVPVSEEGAELVAQAMVERAPVEPSREHTPIETEYVPDGDEDDMVDEDGIPQL